MLDFFFLCIGFIYEIWKRFKIISILVVMILNGVFKGKIGGLKFFFKDWNYIIWERIN